MTHIETILTPEIRGNTLTAELKDALAPNG